jgi:hypothetical protein
LTRERFFGLPKVIESFPAFIYYDLSVSFKIVGRFSLGASYAYTSTGGRVHYADQTGEILVDHVVQGHFIAVHPRIKIIDKPAFGLTLYGKDGLIFSKVKYTERVDVGTTQSRSEESATAMGAAFEFGCIASKKIVGRLYARASVGAHINLSGGEFTFGDPVNEVPLTVDWTGIRASCGVSLRW